MKKILLLASLFCATMVCNAEKVTRVDDFKDGESKFGFEATATKKHSISMDGEYLVITNKKDDWYMAGVRFPVIARSNFTISYKLLLSKLNEDCVYGLVFNYQEDEENPEKSTGDIIYITENKFYVVDADGTKMGKSQKIKLKKGKNVEVNVTVEKKNKKTLISINGVDFVNEDLNIKTPYMGFIVNEKNTLKVDQIKITQNVED